ncbi:hypothetical protein KQ941_08940 [Paenibacillus xylanexedens]|uniref:hypothetical protein n=1 Tax=Paenibacillus xylanexedens TaxID=528191 RepID=UPI001F39583F|nr:hypothetical protein [Paenibacillus xylanexedens]MCF7754561.1 hypothetical protein [Paenibacillus xylanexedens]
MNLYHIQSTVYGVNRVTSFLKDNYIGIAWSGTGDLEQTPPELWKEQLVQYYSLDEAELASTLATLHMFANLMQDGDYVIISDDEWTYVGDIGDYYYDDSAGIENDLICHRRGVTWLGRIPRAELNGKVQALQNDSAILAKFEYPISQAQLDRGLAVSITAEATNSLSTGVDEATIQTALQVLREALHSEEEELRIRAATAILQYAKQ